MHEMNETRSVEAKFWRIFIMVFAWWETFSHSRTQRSLRAQILIQYVAWSWSGARNISGVTRVAYWAVDTPGRAIAVNRLISCVFFRFRLNDLNRLKSEWAKNSKGWTKFNLMEYLFMDCDSHWKIENVQIWCSTEVCIYTTHYLSLLVSDNPRSLPYISCLSLFGHISETFGTSKLLCG